MLEVFPNNALDSIDKDLRFAQALIKIGLEFFSRNGNIGLMFQLPLGLLPAKQGCFFEESDGKWYLMLTLGLCGGKMVLILLKEVIAIPVSFSPIYVWEPDL